MYKININSEIIKKHGDYLTSTKLKNELIKFMSDEDFVLKNKVDKGEHSLFCKLLIIQLENIEKNKNIEKNIFLGNPEVLNKFITYVHRNFPSVDKAFEDEGNLYTKEFLQIMGYEKFSSVQLKEYYIYEKNFFCIYSKKFIREELKKIKEEKNKKRYSNEVFEFFSNSIIKKLEHIVLINSNDSLIKELFEQLLQKIKEIETDNSSLSVYVGQVYETIKECHGKFYNFFESSKCISIINYEEYKKRINLFQWSAYDFLLSIGARVCPYCNRQYITPIYSKDGKVRADLDHFYSKGRYPYLSISIYNLVPSCKFCNSSLKGTKEFSYDSYINPYEESLSDYINFSYAYKSYTGVDGLGDIEIILKDNFNKDIYEIQKARNNINCFGIVNLYQYHTNIVRDLVRKKMVYSEDYIDLIWETNKNIFKTREEVIQNIIGNIPLDQEGEALLGKLITDISEELKF